MLAGAFIVDPPGAPSPPNDRVMVLDIWIDGKTEEGEPDFLREFLVINGRPWPLTESHLRDGRLDPLAVDQRVGRHPSHAPPRLLLPGRLTRRHRPGHDLLARNNGWRSPSE